MEYSEYPVKNGNSVNQRDYLDRNDTKYLKNPNKYATDFFVPYKEQFGRGNSNLQ